MYLNHESTKIHVPNLCVVQQVCTDCIDQDDVSQFYHTCGIREYVFRENPVTQLIELCVRDKTDFNQIVRFRRPIYIKGVGRARESSFAQCYFERGEYYLYTIWAY